MRYTARHYLYMQPVTGPTYMNGISRKFWRLDQALEWAYEEDKKVGPLEPHEYSEIEVVRFNKRVYHSWRQV